MASGTGTPISKAHPAAPSQPAPAKRPIWLIAGCAAVVVVGLVVWLIVRSIGGVEPRLNESTAVLAKFVSTRTFDQLPYEKQRLYYKMLDDRGNKEIDQAFKNKQLNDGEYRNALDAAWLGKHISRVEKYTAMPPGNGRSQYVDSLVSKKLKKEAEQAKSGAAKAAGSEDDADADEAAAELRVDSWPANVRDQWNNFHNAYRREKKIREEAATRPSR